MTKIDRIDTVEKPFSPKCFHHFSGSLYVGAVWLEAEDLGGKWAAYHAVSKDDNKSKAGLGHLGKFDSREAAYSALEKSLEG